jgi:hypothetical protein
VMQVVSREELYEQVWAEPMTKVAAKYGVTGTALKKKCERHEIPTPERGYWMKLEHGKRVRQEPLPKLSDVRLGQVRVVGSASQRLPDGVRQAKAKARQQLDAAKPLPSLPSPEPSVAKPDATEESVAEYRVLTATRRAISKARPDGQGLATARGHGIVPLKIAPASIDRVLPILSRLLALAETQGHRTQPADSGLNLVIDDEPIAFGIEEQPQRTPHVPTVAELKRKEENARWGLSSTPWPKYDHAPSGRLAVTIHANQYAGLRRTYADGKTRVLEDSLTDVLAGFAEHAALLKERRRADEERERQREKAEAGRLRLEAFKTREKRRMEFIDAIHAKVVERARLSAVLVHLENTAGDEPRRTDAVVAWLRRRLRQIDALISPRFLDISARSAKVEFDEMDAGAKADEAGRHFAYLPPVELQFWSIDEETELATSKSALEWAIESGLVPDVEGRQADVREEDDR